MLIPGMEEKKEDNDNNDVAISNGQIVEPRAVYEKTKIGFHI
jgi:hypothetical protein